MPLSAFFAADELTKSVNKPPETKGFGTVFLFGTYGAEGTGAAPASGFPASIGVVGGGTALAVRGMAFEVGTRGGWVSMIVVCFGRESAV